MPAHPRALLSLIIGHVSPPVRDNRHLPVERFIIILSVDVIISSLWKFTGEIEKEVFHGRSDESILAGRFG